jgi:TetR/AcrR family transcriptional regulator
VKRVAGHTREAILLAAATEFAAHGFAGASVDTIAARSRFNKAMIYYHFKSKQGLYVEILREGFRSVGDRTTALVESNLTPEAKIEGFIDTLNAMAATRPYMPPMMMREIAEGAVRLDPDTLRLMARIFGNLRHILEEGARLGVFRPADPILTYFTLITPVIFFRASTPIREAFSRLRIIEFRQIDAAAFIGHLKSTAIAALSAGAGARAARTAPTPPMPKARARRPRSPRPGDLA